MHKSFQKIGALPYIDLTQYELQELIGSSNCPVFCYQHKHTKEKIAIKEVQYKENMEKEIFSKLTLIQNVQKQKIENIIEIKGYTK